MRRSHRKGEKAFALLSQAAARSLRTAGRIIESLEPRRLLDGDEPNWYAEPDGGITTSADGHIDCLDLTQVAKGGSTNFNTTTGWGSTSVTYGFSNLLDGGLPLASGTSLSDIRDAVYEALGMWTAVSPLTFSYASDPGGAVNDNTYNGTGFPQIRIGHHYIDGATGLNVLAHCYFPGGNGRDGDMHFDDSNTWGVGTGGANFLETAAHELGHGIGMLHANGDVSGSCPAPKPAIMDACIQGRFTGLDSAYLFQDDISGIQNIYGSGLGYLVGQDGIARVYGTGVASNVNGQNVITISTTTLPIIGACYTVASSGYGSTIIPAISINGLVVNGLGGNDILRVDNNIVGKPITLYGGDGDDYFDFAYNTGALGGIPQGVTVQGGAGTDRVWTYDQSNGAAATYTISSTRFDRGGWGGYFYDGNVEGLYLRTGSGVDVVNVLSTYPGQPVTLDTAGGGDTVNIGSAGSVSLIRADVQINNQYSYTTLNIDNSADSVNHSWLINDVSAGYGAITGLAPANIVWKNNDINAVNFTTGPGADTGSIARLSVTMNINGAGNTNYDTITIGNSSAGGMQSILNGHSGGLTIDNNPYYTNLNFDDTGDGTARTGTLDLVSGYNQLTGLAPATIRFDDSDTRDVTIKTGSGDDTLSVPRFSFTGSKLLITSAQGRDTVNLGNATDGVQSLLRNIEIDNPPSFTTLNINDTGNATARSVTIDYDAGTDLQSVLGLAQYGIYYDPGDIDSTNGVSITSGSQSDTFSIIANQRKLSLANSNGTAETVNIGPDLSRIAGDIYTRNSPSFTNVNISDASNTVARSLFMQTTTIGAESFESVYGFGAAIYAKIGDTRSPITVNAGTGDDTLTLLSSSLAYTLNGNNGTDTFNLGSTVSGARNADPVNGGVAVNGGNGDDSLFFNDQDYGVAGGIVSTDAGTLTTNHTGAIAFSDVSLLEANLANVGETMTVLNTAADYTVNVRGGTAKDILNIANTAAGSYVQLFASGGLDDVSVDSTGAGTGSTLRLAGATFDLGALVINNSGTVIENTSNMSVRVKSLAIVGNGRIDIRNGALVVDYSGASPSSSIRTWLLSGLNAGSWNGPGINSTTVAGTPQYAVGYAESAEIRSAFPASFGSFSDVDNTSVLIRYTLKGDSNLDRAVNFDDLLALSQNYSLSGKTWSKGDFDYTGTVAFDDLLALSQNYGLSFATDWVSSLAQIAVAAIVPTATLPKDKRAPATRGRALA